MTSSKESETDLRIRAEHLFALCDKEEKGFVTKRDMQRMKNEMPLEPEQLELVFDSLDADGNGFLTFDEFIQGFGIYMEEGQSEDERETADPKSTSVSSFQEDAEEDDENFMKLLDTLGGDRVFEDEDSVKVLWNHFRQDDPNATIQFEKFLERVSRKIQNKEQEKLTMEEFLRNQNETREEQMKRMYEEMDQQIKQERELAIQAERMKEAQVKSELKEAIEKKDRQLEELQSREKELMEALNRLQESDSLARQELATSSKEKRKLETQLELQTKNVEELRSALERLRRESVNERRQRAMAAFSVSEKIAAEREGLVEQLHLLKSINTRLTDESDLRDYGNGEEDGCGDDGMNNIARQLQQVEDDDCDDGDDQPIVMNDTHLQQISNLMGNPVSRSLTKDLSTESNVSSLFDELANALEPAPCVPASENRITAPARQHHPGFAERSGSFYQSSISIPINQSAVHPDSWTTVTQGSHVVTWIVQSSVPSITEDIDETGWIQVGKKSTSSETSSIAGVDPVVAFHNHQWTSQVHLRKREPITPSTVFKVIIIGDAGCGKTSFIRRFCCDDFDGPDIPSRTVGIDLSVRCLAVGNDQQIALQFWDTAGKRSRQERYRSITRQYLRRADAIVIMYDVTSETSFLNVRHWMESIKEVVEEDVTRVLVGNKTDLVSPKINGGDASSDSVDTRQVPTAAGVQLAEETGADFFETSAKTGYMVQQCVVALAAKLQVRQDYIMENALLMLGATEETRNGCPLSVDDEDDDRHLDEDGGNKCCSI